LEVSAANISSEQQRAGKLVRNLVLFLLGMGFFVFVAGSFVFAYYTLISPPSQGTQGPLSVLPSVPRISIPGGPTIGGDKIGIGPDSAEPADNRRINFLLLGIDQRDDEKGVPTRSDTIIVLSLDQASKTAAMISFPRDMWVQIPGYADNRINVANFLGDAYKYPGGGPAMAEKTLEQNFGIKCDYYARVDFHGLEKIVDTLGGVDINVENAIRDDEYPTDDYETMSIYIPAGKQHMNGRVALQYARSRHSENDFGRAKRQHKVLVAIKDKALALDVIPKIPSLMGTMKDMIDTDIPPADIIRLATLAKDINASSVSSLVIDDKLAPPFIGEGGANLLAPNAVEIRKAIAQLLADPVIKSEAAKIEIQNGTAKAGLTKIVPVKISC
jgi:LCP family protein required for cell wall assembly